MSKYGLDLDKIESRFHELLSTGSDKEMAVFAKEVIPLLIQDSRRTRMEVVNGLLRSSTCNVTSD